MNYHPIIYTTLLHCGGGEARAQFLVAESGGRWANIIASASAAAAAAATASSSSSVRRLNAIATDPINNRQQREQQQLHVEGRRAGRRERRGREGDKCQ